MTYLLGAAGRAALRDFLKHRTLLSFDYDGTLAPIRRRTIDAILKPRTRTLWAGLCAQHPCAVISGRGLADLRARMHGIGPCTLVGNHGMEPDHGRPAGARWHAQVERWVTRLGEQLAPLEGVLIEPKAYSLSVHWRGAPHPRRVTQTIWAVARALPGTRLIGGKRVLNVLPAGAKHKGDAVRYAMRRARCHQAIFVGDDVTDEDGFALAESETVLGVRVGRKRDTRARFYLRSQGEMDGLLEFLLKLGG